MPNQAKYKRKPPIVSIETRFCLTEDDIDLGVTICHIQEDCLEPELTFWQFERSPSFLMLTVLLQLPNSILISLLVHCFHCGPTM
jgi:hypothetical protein